MRQLAVAVVSLSFVFVIGTLFLGCGGGSGTVPAVTINLSPSLLSLNRGSTAQILATALSANNVIISTPTLAYHSDNPSITVSSNGLVCAGQWDANFIVCRTQDGNGTALPLGRANITATATFGNTVVTSSTVVVTDHERIDKVIVVPTGGPFDFSTSTACASQSGTAQFTAQASNNVTGQIPSDLIGSVNWGVSPPQVATLDNPIHLATDPATVTAAAPGRGTVTASIGLVGNSAVSGSALFTTCPVSSIHVHVQNPTAPDTDTFFSKAKGNSVTLLADVLDSRGTSLSTTLSLTWTSSQPGLVSVSNGQVATLAPGTASVAASCTPPSCNDNLTQITGSPFAIYSDDVVVANVTGTAASTVFVGSLATPPSNLSNTILPIDTTTNNPGAPFTLPVNVALNSIVLAPVGNPGYLGTNEGMITFNSAVTTVPNPVASFTGRVLATDGVRIVLSDATSTPPQAFIVNANSAIEATIPVGLMTGGAATSAAFARDGSKIYIIANGHLIDYTPGLPPRTIISGLSGTTPPSLQQVAFFPTGAMAYVADAGDDVVATCTDGSQHVGVTGTPSHIAAITNGTGMVEANSPNIDEIDVSSSGTCPPAINTVGITTHDLGVGTFTAQQLLVTLDSSLAIVISDKGVLLYDIKAKQTKTAIQLSPSGTVPLTGAGRVPAAVTPDGASLYVGASDGKVHRVDLTTFADTPNPIVVTSLCAAGTTNCNPDLVVMKPTQTLATVTKITVAPTNPTIKVGQTQNFTATGTFSDNTTRDITNFVIWSSSNTVVATIIPNTGQATGMAVGTSTITATLGNVSGTTLLTVQ